MNIFYYKQHTLRGIAVEWKSIELMPSKRSVSYQHTFHRCCSSDTNHCNHLKNLANFGLDRYSPYRVSCLYWSYWVRISLQSFILTVSPGSYNEKSLNRNFRQFILTIMRTRVKNPSFHREYFPTNFYDFFYKIRNLIFEVSFEDGLDSKFFRDGICFNELSFVGQIYNRFS